MANWSEEDLSQHYRNLSKPPVPIPAVAPAPIPKRPWEPYRSKTELLYATHLELSRKTGEIGEWRYEVVTLVLAPGVRYIPDFMVVKDGQIEFHEVKGRKGVGFWSLPVSKVKIRMAASRFPWWKFRIVWPGGSSGTWDTVEIERGR
jgi:hypothetical protein